MLIFFILASAVQRHLLSLKTNDCEEIFTVVVIRLASYTWTQNLCAWLKMIMFIPVTRSIVILCSKL